MDARRALLLRFYQALDAKDVEAVMAILHPDIDLPDQIDGGRRVGAAAVRAYYEGVFALVDSENTPMAFQDEPDGTLVVRVHHHVTSPDGALWHDGPVDYGFAFKDGLIVRMERIGD